MRAVGYWAVTKPTADSIMALELCVSDANKPLLLDSPDFIPYLVDALLLDADHPRAGMKPELKAWCQEHHAECVNLPNIGRGTAARARHAGEQVVLS